MIKNIRAKAHKYNSKVAWHKDSNIIKILKGMIYLSLPHLISTSILILIFSEKWLGILIVGFLLSDLSTAFVLLMRKWFKTNHYLNKQLNINKINNINHIILISTLIVLAFQQEWIILSSGLAHLFLDWIGF